MDMVSVKSVAVVCLVALFLGGLNAQNVVCPSVAVYAPECPFDVDNECLSDQECSTGRKCCPSPFDDQACQLLCLDPVPQETCPLVVDFAFILDGSGSISRNNWKRIKEFVSKIVDAFEVSEEGAHFALLEYSDEPTIYLRFNDFTGAQLNVVNVKRKIEEILQSKNTTYIDKALIMASEEIFTEEAGMRPNVKKLALVLTDGEQTDDGDKEEAEDRLVAASQLLKDKGVDVLSLGIGRKVDIFQLLAIASEEDNLYRASVFDELIDLVDNLTKRECLACDKPLDVVFGIPTSLNIPREQFEAITRLVADVLESFETGPNKVHAGLLTYSGDASTTLNIDEIYSKEVLKDFSTGIPQRGNNVNVAAALDEAFRNTFTIYGGVRQTAPKVFVLFVPAGSSSSQQDVLQAAERLKSLGVRLVAVAVGPNVDQNLYRLASTQPSSKFFYNIPDPQTLPTYSRSIADIVCSVKEGKCPLLPPPPERCPQEVAHECNTDADCSGALTPLCCQNGCGRTCYNRISSCFVPMDIAIALHSSEVVTTPDFRAVKDFLKRLIRRVSNAENSIRYALLDYGNTANVLADFRKHRDQLYLENVLDNLEKRTDARHRVDLALDAVKEKLFSIEGGMRQGFPRYLIFVVADEPSVEIDPLAGAAKELLDLGVTTVAIGINRDVPGSFLQRLASDSRFIYRPDEADELAATVLDDLAYKMCAEKPGECPLVEVTPDPEVCQNAQPEEQTRPLCGLSTNGSGTNGKSYDWDCPGESKCCLDPITGCFQVCIEPPNVCRGDFDLTIVMENSAEVGEEGFGKVKTFAKQFVDAFDVQERGTQVAVVSYGSRPLVQTRFDSFRGPDLNNRAVIDEIDRIRFRDDTTVSTSSALSAVLNTIYEDGNGVRGDSNKSVVIITEGRLSDPSRAIQTARDIRAKGVDVFVVAVGDNPDVDNLEKLVSPPVDNDVFMTSSYDALRPHLRGLTDTVCQGAEKMVIVPVMHQERSYVMGSVPSTVGDVVVGAPGDPGLAGPTGPPGPPGPRGIRGDRGEPGDPGEKGIAGSPGLPGRPGGGGIIGPPGEAGPSNIVPGDKGPVVVPFISGRIGPIRQSMPGSPGKRGPRGPDGPPGFPGNRGPLGARGEIGMMGYPGVPGRRGRRGTPGEQGKRGNIGPPGTPGQKGPPGDSGEQGHDGMKGPRGRRGTVGGRGDPGEEGESGEQGVEGVAGKNGKEGRRGPRGSTGRNGRTGAAGSPGAKGVAGSIGDQGIPGPPGSPGPPGLSGQKGEDGKPGRVGDIGYQGDSGSMGPSGPKGKAGRDGETGSQGSFGAKGSTGDSGSRGEMGAPGNGGSPGQPGSIGSQGYQGSTGNPGMPGARGVLGDKGKPGKQGIPGLRGMPGQRGKRGGRGDLGATGIPGSAGESGMSGSQGFMGPPGVLGLKGVAGSEGPIGPPGRPGDQGDGGDYGALGAPGEQGPPGGTGSTGRAGSPGLHGMAGETGTTGKDGSPGLPGNPGVPGSTGVKGGQGKPGEPGPQGETGPEGPKGTTGIAGLVGAPGNTGQQGSIGERGESGETGLPGEVGLLGPPGSKGSAGMAGAPGAKGDDGLNGVPGSRGFAGKAGNKGESGFVGETGTAGERGDPGKNGRMGGQGPIGQPGDPGSQGRMGTAGTPGPPGTSGSKGSLGFAGSPGDRGRKGSNGKQGDDGDPGSRGSRGASGSKGTAGVDGMPGMPGSSGDMGPSGDSGEQGQRGFEGPSGTLGPVGSTGPTGNPGPKGSSGEQGAGGPGGSSGPEGAPGQMGPIGLRGDRGSLGMDGAPGNPGPPGLTGLSGEVGSFGKPGPAGTPGQSGSLGDTGMPGSAGAVGFPGRPGIDGSPGNTGDGGLQGSRGPPGPPGPPGRGGQLGNPGLPGLKGKAGDTGSKGPTGDAGTIGKDGPEGKRGGIGMPGSAGSSGEPGTTGLPGTIGPAGNRGSRGFKGDAGSPGAQGKSGLRGNPGRKGAPGERGANGASGTDGAPGSAGGLGLKGILGTEGDPGEPGDVGTKGEEGKKGDRGDQGQTGPPGGGGMKGPDGDVGLRGDIGPPGSGGSDGIQGLSGNVGLQGSEGTAGPDGFRGETGDSGLQGPEGEPGPPGPPGPPGQPAELGPLGLGQIWSAGGYGASNIETGKAELYRSTRYQNSENAIDPVKLTLALLHHKLDLHKKPNGTKEFPARTCRDLIMCYPNLKSGEFWIDPNEGITQDAIKVFCDFSYNATCLYSSQEFKPFVIKKRKWYSGPDEYKWLSNDLHAFHKIKYVQDSSQLSFLRLQSDRARQTITYHCKDSAAWYNDRFNGITKSIRFKTDNGILIDANSSNKFRPKVLVDNCRVKNGTWLQTTIEVDTPKPSRLPLLDVAAYDIGDTNEEFGLEIGPVCFY